MTPLQTLIKRLRCVSQQLSISSFLRAALSSDVLQTLASLQSTRWMESEMETDQIRRTAPLIFLHLTADFSVCHPEAHFVNYSFTQWANFSQQQKNKR